MNVTQARRLPHSSLSVTALGLGCAQLGGLYDPMT